MKNNKLHKMIICLMGILLGVILLAGCRNEVPDEGVGTTENTQDLLEGTKGLFLILEHNTSADIIRVYSYENGEEYVHMYDINTKFYDKFGSNEPMDRFTPGRVIELAPKNAAGYLTELHISDEVWEQKNIIRFSVNQKENIFTIGDVNYSMKGEVPVFSNGEQIDLEDLWEEDVLSVVGKGTQILSVNVEKGHGTLKFTNTALFKESLANIGDLMYVKVEEAVEFYVPEGKHNLTVAKDGWGSTTEITIVRGETLEIDLDTIKGDGPKKGTVIFKINVEDVKVRVDYKEVDVTKPVELVYGTHVLEISAEGYTSWKGKIVVGKESATIEIELEEKTEKPTEPDSDKDKNDKDTEKDSEKGSESKKDGASANS